MSELDDLSPTTSSNSGIPSLDDVPVAQGSSGSMAGPNVSSTSMAAGLGPSATVGIDLRALGRKLGRWAAWGFGLLFVFIISAWISLPTRSIAWRISHEARKAGFNINVDDVKIRPWGSAKLEHVVWSFKPSRPDSTPVPFVIEELDISFSLFRYLVLDDLDLEFEGTLDEGKITGAFFKSDEKSRIAFAIEKLPLYAVPKLQEAVNAPVRGYFELSVDMTAPNNEWAKSSGRLEVHCQSCTIGDGQTKLYVPGTKKKSMLRKGVTIPEIDLGALDGVLEIVDGKAVAEEFGTESEDIQFKISGDITFKDPIQNSRLNLLIKIFISPSLRERSDNIDLLVATASPKVKMDPPDEGWLGVVLEGNFKHRRFRGIKRKSRAQRLREKRDRRNRRAKERREERARKRAARKKAKEKQPEEQQQEEAQEQEEVPPEVLSDPQRQLPPEAGIVREEAGDEAGDEEEESEEEEPGEDEEELDEDEEPDEEDETEGEEQTEDETEQFPQ